MQQLIYVTQLTLRVNNYLLLKLHSVIFGTGTF